MNRKIYIVEDDADIAELLQYNFQVEGFDAEIIPNGDEAYNKIMENPPDLLLLDLMLPGLSGIELCRYIRESSKIKELPVIMLTAKSQEVDKIIGLKIGADDYVTKPFSIKELIARVNALLRRTNLDVDSTFIRGNLMVDFNRVFVECEGSAVTLTKTEFKLLKSLIKANGRVISRLDLVDMIWENDGNIDEHTVNVNIKRLRDKLGSCNYFIKTVQGLGYRFDV